MVEGGTDEPGIEGAETEVSDPVVAEEDGDDPDPVVYDEEADGPDAEVRTDNRSSRGAFRGGHRGSVSTLAKAGLGPVFGNLRSQGYGDIRIEQVGQEILVSAARSGEERHLVYDATTGALVSDVSAPQSGLLATIAGKLKKDPVARSVAARAAAKSKSESSDRAGWGKGGNDKGVGSKGQSSKGGGSKGGGTGGGSKGGGSGGGSKSGSSGGGSKGGGNGNGGGGGKSH